MLYYNVIDINKGINPAKSNNSKKCTIYHYWFFNYGFGYQNSFVMVAMTWQCYVLLLVILLLSLLKGLIIVVLSGTLANLQQFIC